VKNRAWSAISQKLTFRLALTFFESLYEDESGQGTLEYILILSVTVLGASALGKAILNVLDNGILVFGGQLEKDLHTGKAPVSVWTN
jgi:hypothetical protein